MPAVPVEVVTVHQAEEVGDRERRLGPKQLQLHRAAIGDFDHDMRMGRGVRTEDVSASQVPIVLEGAPGDDG